MLEVTPTLRVDPQGELISLEDRQKIAAAVEDELQRLHWDEVREDAFWRGAPCGVGGVMIRLETDPLTQAKKIALDEMDMRRFLPDPNYTRPHKWRFAAYEPYLDLSTIIEYFPERGHLVQAKPERQAGKYTTDGATKRTDDEMINTPGGEAIVTKEGAILQRGADVCMVWVKDDTLSQELLKKTVGVAETFAQCPQCGALMHADIGTGGEQMCMACQYSGPMPTIEKPAETEDYTEVSRAYPYGRLIAYSGDVLLYDGPNNLPLGPDDIYPFAFYVHRTVAGRFWGYGDVPLGKSIQMAIDKNAAQAIDALRMNFNGPFEYPAEAEAYTNLGSAPGVMVPVPLPFCGKARHVRPDSTNIALFQTVEEILQRDMQRVLEVTDVSVGIAPTAPTSGVEVQARVRAASTGTGAHLKRLTRFDSQLAQKVYQVGCWSYVGPRMVTPRGATQDMEPVEIDWSQLPKSVKFRVEANLDALQRDENMAQNLIQLLSNPALVNSPFFNLATELITKDPIMSEEVKMVQASAPPPQPQIDPDAVLTAVANGAKAGLPVALNQWEAALMMAGLPPPEGKNVTPPPKTEEKPTGGESK